MNAPTLPAVDTPRWVSNPHGRPETASAPITRTTVEKSSAGTAPLPGPRDLGTARNGTARVRTASATPLPDIASATFGPRPEMVIGNDDRIQVAATTAHPWRMNASLQITAADGSSWIGTGWFIGPRTLVTAGHCVYVHAPGRPYDGWVRSIEVMPGRQGTALPYRSAISRSFRAVPEWAGAGTPDERYDFAAIILDPGDDLGAEVGAYGLGVYLPGELDGVTVGIAGYPGDKPVGTQWFHSREIGKVTDTEVYYDVDTAAGQSGSAVYRVVDDQYIAVAVHAYGDVTANHGTRITPEIRDLLMEWRT